MRRAEEGRQGGWRLEDENVRSYARGHVALNAAARALIFLFFSIFFLHPRQLSTDVSFFAIW